MPDFMPEPSRVLETLADLIGALANSEEWQSQPYPYGWHVKSLWLIALIDESTAARGFAYNSEVKRLAEERLGYPPKPDAAYSNESDALSQLIYNAQRYRRSDALRAAGYAP